MNVEVMVIDYKSEKHQLEMRALLDAYAKDPVDGGKPLAESVKQDLVTELSKIQGAFSVVAYVDDVPAGLVNCFASLSTFQCEFIVNIHDVIVLE